jgi:hypothetical protein
MPQCAIETALSIALITEFACCTVNMMFAQQTCDEFAFMRAKARLPFVLHWIACSSSHGQ